MDVSEVKQRLLTGFKPKQQDFPTPYLGDLDGQFKLVGLSGKDALALKQMAIVKRLDLDGKEQLTYDDAKLAGLAIIKCLYHKESGQPVLDQLIPTQGPQAGNAADLQELLGLDYDVFNQLGGDVLSFAGIGSKAVTDAKKNSETPPSDGNATSPSNSQAGSDGQEASTAS